MFYVGFVSAKRVDEQGWPHAEGELTVGGHAARFRADLRAWSMRDYERQWRDAVARLLGGETTSALLVSYRGPDADYHTAWAMWREGTTVHLQERVIFPQTLGRPFVPEEVHEHVGERGTHTDDGEPVREWTLPLGRLATFVSER